MRFDPVECGKRMKALRESKNLTQMQLAEQLNPAHLQRCQPPPQPTYQAVMLLSRS
mgnify:CR=1 FL=1